jgi:hypothetical protein
MTPSEKYIAELCERSFLPFWSFPNPIGKKNKELCDVLVVCGSIIIIISVKDIRVSEHHDKTIQYERWVKKAILDSNDQIHGAERFLQTVDEVRLKDRKVLVSLPPKEHRKIYRVAIAFGSSNDFPLPTGNFGKGYIHVFDETSTDVILRELDTIIDFTDYLSAKEIFMADKTIVIPYEIDFLAIYLQTGLDIDVPADAVIAGERLWDDYTKSKEYAEWQEDITVSYVWDFMVREIHKNHINENTLKDRRDELESAIRTINLEPRINRIELGAILDNAIKKKVGARMLQPIGESKHTYVFMPLTDKNWNLKEGELELRCMVARHDNPTVTQVVGISIGSNSNGDSCFDIFSLKMDHLTEDFKKQVNQIKEELGYFKKPVISHSKDFRQK